MNKMLANPVREVINNVVQDDEVFYAKNTFRVALILSGQGLEVFKQAQCSRSLYRESSEITKATKPSLSRNYPSSANDSPYLSMLPPLNCSHDIWWSPEKCPRWPSTSTQRSRSPKSDSSSTPRSHSTTLANSTNTPTASKNESSAYSPCDNKFCVEGEEQSGRIKARTEGPRATYRQDGLETVEAGVWERGSRIEATRARLLGSIDVCCQPRLETAKLRNYYSRA